MGRSPGGGPAGEGTLDPDAAADSPIGETSRGEGRRSRNGEQAPGPSVLVLFSDTGGGHRAAARALDAALRAVEPGACVTWCDPLIGEGHPIVRRLASLYPEIIKRSGTAWGAIYHASNTGPSFALVSAVFGALVGTVVARRMAATDPDVVLSVHPLVNHVAWSEIKRGARPRALVTVVTDLIDLHCGWAHPGADLVVVPTGEAQAAVVRYGVPKERVRLLGLPVDLRFRPPQPGEQAAVRRQLGLDLERRTVLVVGGGEGSGRLLQQVRALAWAAHEWQVVAVCGRNEKLRRRLHRLNFGTPTLVLGFVDDMPDLLRAADVAVTKAGPGAIAEALATGVPLVLTGYLPGQETPNVRFVTRSGVGLYAPRPDQLLETVRRLLVLEGTSYEAMRERAQGLSRPTASLDIARECLLIAARYRAASQASR